MTTDEVFDLLSSLCSVVSPLLPGAAKTIVEFAGVASKAGAAWVKAGDDPVMAITRHLDMDKLEDAREAHWAAELQKRRFIEVPAAKKSEDEDIYEDK